MKVAFPETSVDVVGALEQGASDASHRGIHNAVVTHEDGVAQNTEGRIHRPSHLSSTTALTTPE